MSILHSLARLSSEVARSIIGCAARPSSALHYKFKYKYILHYMRLYRDALLRRAAHPIMLH